EGDADAAHAREHATRSGGGMLPAMPPTRISRAEPAFREAAPGVLQWSVREPGRDLDFNGTIVIGPGGNVAIDPVDLSVAQMDALWEHGGIAHVVVTNRHHGRRTPDLVQRTGALVHASWLDAAALA